MRSLSQGGRLLSVIVPAVSLALAVGLAAWLTAATAEPAKTTRTPWTTSRVVG